MFQQVLNRSFVNLVFTYFNVVIEAMPGVPGGGVMAWIAGEPVFYVNSEADAASQSAMMYDAAARLALGYDRHTPRNLAEANLVDRHVTAVAARLAVPEHMATMAEANGLGAAQLARMAGTTERLAEFALFNNTLVYGGVDQLLRRCTTFRQVLMSRPKRSAVG